MNVGRMLLAALRIGITIQLILGLVLWFGYGYQYVGLHRAVGVLVVVILWGIALVAMARRRHLGLAAFAILWGVLIAALGMTQQRLITGDFHWVIRVLHLAMGLAAMPIAERLARSSPTPLA